MLVALALVAACVLRPGADSSASAAATQNTGSTGATGNTGSATTSTTPAPTTQVVVYPTPGDIYELPGTQITFRGIPASEIGTVTVTGSQSGVHPGKLEADADGDGASFIPDRPFEKNETVTVSTDLNIAGGTDGTFHFTIEHPGPHNIVEKLTPATGPDPIQHFYSNPGLQPATVDVTQNDAPASDGDIFVAPQRGPSQNGPMILNSAGKLVWFQPYPLSKNEEVTDFKVQELDNQPVLTYVVGTLGNGVGDGVGEIYNDHYQKIATVQAGNGLQVDLHDFVLTNNGDAWIVAGSPVMIPAYKRPVMNWVVQEIEIKTGLVLYQWDALDHINPNNSYVYGHHVHAYVEDPFHVNSISFAPGGDPVISMRNMDAAFKINPITGAPIWELGGRHSSFKMGPGTDTAFQHDVEVNPNGSVTIFDDGAGPPLIRYSRAIEESINDAKGTVTLTRSINHSPDLSAFYEGSVQELADGRLFVGWGQQPFFSEYNAQGAQIFDAHFTTTNESYRAYRFPWTGTPYTRPSLATALSGGKLHLYASWNGATEVSKWRVLYGASSKSLTTTVGTYDFDAFETDMEPPITKPGYVEVQALDSAGKVLSTSVVKQVT